MSRSDWLPKLTTGGLIAAALVGLLGFGVPATYCVASNTDSSAYRQHQPEERAAGHADASEKGQDQENSGPITLGLSRIAREIEKSNAREDAPDKAAHEKSDVDAQWAMSQWGCLMTLMSFWQFVAAVIGILFISRTLDLTRIATDAATNGGKALVALERAYLFEVVDKPFLGLLDGYMRTLDVATLSPGQKHPSISFKFINHGKTPAIVKTIEAGVDMTTPWAEPDYGTSFIVKEVILPSGGTTDSYTIRMLIPIDAKTQAAFDEGRLRIKIYARALYDDVFGTSHETRFYWSYDGRFSAYVPHNVTGKEYNKRT